MVDSYYDKDNLANLIKNNSLTLTELSKMYKDARIPKKLFDELTDFINGKITYEQLQGTKTKKIKSYGKEINEEFDTSGNHLDLGSKIYSNIATIFGIIYATVGLFFGLFIGGVEGFTFLLAFAIVGIFLYLSISWFGRVLKGLEQNNKLLKEILKK